ncbi:MAG: hypothetical protein U1F44_07175 [Coriobacteriia bacterium]|nr:hypothetical protein [Coriobacteriia bacterium]
MPSIKRYALVVLLMFVLLALATIPACAPSVEPLLGPEEPEIPGEPDLSTPQAAVTSYLTLLNFSYRMANSEAAASAMTSAEWVRVDAYIQLNCTKNRAIEQHLDLFEGALRSIEASRAIVTATEDWRYRYFDLDSVLYTSDVLSISYETTYTVLQQSDGRWLVDSVEATSSTPPQ